MDSVFVPLGCTPRSGVTVHMIPLGLTVGGTARPFSKVAAPFHIPTSIVRVLIPLYLQNICYYVIFKNYSHPRGYQPSISL